jgi:uncharacterized protein YebE (UPF0316 family)
VLESVGAALLILLLRCFDVTLGTMRLVYVVEGRRQLAVTIAFFEAAAFVVAVSIVLSDLNDPVRMIGYAAGFAGGNAIGMAAVDALKLGSVSLRFFMPKGPAGLADALRGDGFRLTVFDAEGRDGPVRMIMMSVRRKELDQVFRLAKPWLSECFVTVGEEPYSPAASGVRK